MDGDLIFTAVMMVLTSAMTLLAQWLRRDKTESEADVNMSQAEKIKADTVVMLYQTIAQISKGVQDQAKAMQDQAKATIDYIKSIDSLKRDIWRLEGESQRLTRQDADRLTQMAALELQVAELMQSKIDLETKVDALTIAKIGLEKRVADLVKSSAEKDDQIEKMRGRIQALEIENKRLEAKESAGENGTGDEKDAPVAAKPGAKPPETVIEKSGSGK